MPRADFHFSHPLRVRWAEVDLQGVVFNAHYLTYFDVAQTEYLRHIGFPYGHRPEGGGDLHLVESRITYRAPARFDEELDVLTRVSRLGRSSMTCSFEIHRRGEDDPLVTGESVYVCVDLDRGKSTPLPEPFRAAILKQEGDALAQPAT